MRGHEVASEEVGALPAGTIEMQAPFFKERGLDLSGFHRGTLNISAFSRGDFEFAMLLSSFLIGSVDVQTPARAFLLSACWLTFRNQRYAGLIYYPHPETKARHHQNDSVIEVLAPWIEGIQYGDHLDLEVRV